MKKKVIYTIFGIVLVMIILLVTFSSGKEYKGVVAKVYKSSSCGCCGNYIPYLKNEGFKLEIFESQDISYIKRAQGVPESHESCHTIVIGDYFIEGHVPLEAVDKLLTEKPNIDGITLPNMPSGSPGMPGRKTGDFVVYSVKDGKISEFMRV